MDNETLNELARLFGWLYNTGLRESELCKQRDTCTARHDGVCGCVSVTKDVVDMIWEAKAGKPERLDAYMAKAMARGEQ